MSNGSSEGTVRITIRGDELLLFPEVEATDVRTGVADEMAVEHPDWEVEVTFPDDEFQVWRAMVMNVAWKVRRPARRIRREPT